MLDLLTPDTLPHYNQGLHKQGLQLRFLNEISTRLQSLLKSQNFYQEILIIIQNYFNYYSIQIWSVGVHGGYTLQAQAGSCGELFKIGQSVNDSSGIIGASIRSKRAYLANDVSSDPLYLPPAATRPGKGIDTQAQLAIPILNGNKVIAVLSIESLKLQAFDETDVATLEAVSSQVAVAMTNRQLYREATDFNKKLQQAIESKILELRRAHQRILEQQKLLQKENQALKTLMHQDPRKSEIIAQSPLMSQLLGILDKVAPTQAPILLQGESGTGKEFLARRIHDKSERNLQPFFAIHCGALPETLLEVELFGADEQAPSYPTKMGVCEAADGGTLFLNQVGEMPLNTQAKLQRFLKEGKFYRCGGQLALESNVRIISATSGDLEKAVGQGHFREELFYRLNTISLSVPPLRKRKEDIPLFVDFFFRHSSYALGSHYGKIDAKARLFFQEYDWPGNIRELQNTVERLKILAEHQEITLQDLKLVRQTPSLRLEKSWECWDQPLASVEKAYILGVLSFHQGNKSKTAASLRITLKTLYNKLERYEAGAGASASSPSSTLFARRQGLVQEGANAHASSSSSGQALDPGSKQEHPHRLRDDTFTQL